MNKYFDKLYCITTLGDDTRWNNMIDEFTKIGIDINDVEPVRQLFPDNVDKRESLNNVWIKIAKDAKANNYEKIIVFEDDFTFINYELFDQFIKDLEIYGSDWDMVHLGGLMIRNSEIENGIKKNYKASTYLQKHPNHLVRITNNLLEINGGSVHCAHSVGIKNTLFDKIIEFDKIDGRDIENKEYRDIIIIDHLLQLEFQEPDKYNTFMAFPAITESIPNKSNMRNGITDWGETKQPLYKALLEIEPLNK